tara:strand:- start:994 stop:1785 length:792 start_codon:yes stop_codon:yes gene_type:complete
MARERQRLQYTPHDVKHISHKHFEVTRLNDSPNGNFKLEVSNIDLDDYGFPLDAELSVIIKQGSENLRTQEIGNVRKPETDSFEVDFENKVGRITCRINVTPKDETIFIGISDWRHPTHANNIGIFEIRDEDLGDMVWNFEIPTDNSAKPSLILNNRIPYIRDLVFKDNILLQGSILPTVLKMGIEHILFSGDGFEGIEEEGTWQALWWQFAADRMDDVHDILDSEDKEEKLAWCLELVKKFTDHQQYHQLILESLNIQEDDE